MPNVKEKVFQNSLETCEYIDGYKNSNSIIKVHCLIHDLNFETKYENVSRDNRKHHICPQCQQEDRDKKYANQRITLKCAYCGKEFTRTLSHANKSKSELYFCCREHKDLAQGLNSGENFETLRPDHYGTTVKNYRDLAFRNYPHQCAVCGYNEEPQILQVHHKDENRKNNSLDNLIILCPNCHWKITLHLYELIDNKLIKI